MSRSPFLVYIPCSAPHCGIQLVSKVPIHREPFQVDQQHIGQSSQGQLLGRFALLLAFGTSPGVFLVQCLFLDKIVQALVQGNTGQPQLLAWYGQRQ